MAIRTEGPGLVEDKPAGPEEESATGAAGSFSGLADAQLPTLASDKVGKPDPGAKQPVPQVDMPGGPVADDTDDFNMFGFGC
jgi:hypothetical protein